METEKNRPDPRVILEHLEEKANKDTEREAPSLKTIIREQATEEDMPFTKNLTLRKILGGDILSANVIRQQIWLILLISLFIVVYISNRYKCQQDLIRISNLTEQLKSPEWHYLLQGPGRGITMSNGTLVFAGQFIDAQRVPNACIMYSKDHGKTWNISKLARTNTTEAQVAELEPGVLMLNMRDNRGGSRAVSTTTDMGESWYEHKSSRSALKEPICMASLISVKAKDNILGKDLLLFSNPNHTKQRKDITIKISFDGGYTWPEESQIKLDAEPGWGYSCLTMIDRETVGILYESSVAQMTFQAIKLRDFIH